MKPTLDRVGRLDVVIAAAAGMLGLLSMMTQPAGARQPSVLATAMFVAVAVPLLWRRAAPLGALAGTGAVVLVHAALFGDLVRCGLVLPLAFVLVFAAGARLDRQRSMVGLVLALGIGLTVSLTDGPEGARLDALAYVAPVMVAVWLAGRLVRSRGQLVGELEVRTSELRQARDERARLEVADDRARLSAELDELLQRRLAELARLADGGARGAFDGDAQIATQTLAQIERESRQTLEQMRALVGVLRSDEADAPMAPQPTLTHLEALLMRAKGARARLNVEGRPRALPAAVELSAYRVVEHLLDALEDAADVKVRVRFGEDEIELTVTGPARRRGEAAIERARERARLHSGTLQATTHGGRAEAVVSLPILATV
ncbi:MAG: hypothetical protein KY463_11595 [Actinobacteria bacterium]|nr:hypothetical protein [Actinomycetota bacterium]